eukprot:2012847-Rhodomonas_salina.1
MVSDTLCSPSCRMQRGRVCQCSLLQALLLCFLTLGREESRTTGQHMLLSLCLSPITRSGSTCGSVMAAGDRREERKGGV